MEGPEQPPLTRLRLGLTAAAVVAMGGVGYVSVVIAAFAAYPACVATKPPGPPAFLAAALLTVLVCGGVPALVVGVRRRRAALIAFAVGAATPLVFAVYVASRTNNGFCF